MKPPCTPAPEADPGQQPRTDASAPIPWANVVWVLHRLHRQNIEGPDAQPAQDADLGQQKPRRGENPNAFVYRCGPLKQIKAPGQPGAGPPATVRHVTAHRFGGRARIRAPYPNHVPVWKVLTLRGVAAQATFHPYAPHSVIFRSHRHATACDRSRRKTRHNQWAGRRFLSSGVQGLRIARAEALNKGGIGGGEDSPRLPDGVRVPLRRP